MRAPALRTQTSTGMSSWRKQEPALLPTPPSNTYVLRLSLVGIAHIPSSGFQGVPGELTWGLIVLGRKHLSVHAAPCLGMTPDLVLGELLFICIIYSCSSKHCLCYCLVLCLGFTFSIFEGFCFSPFAYNALMVVVFFFLFICFFFPIHCCPSKPVEIHLTECLISPKLSS